MIKQKITKDQFKSIVQVIDTIRAQLKKEKPDLKEWDLAMANAHLCVLTKLSQKMRSKLPLMEDMAGDHKITWSVDENQALILMSRKNVGNGLANSFNLGTFEEISGPIFKVLLS